MVALFLVLNEIGKKSNKFFTPEALAPLKTRPPVYNERGTQLLLIRKYTLSSQIWSGLWFKNPVDFSHPNFLAILPGTGRE
jgi:hypothetical protein